MIYQLAFPSFRSIMFITIEGCEGAGKTSAIQIIQQFFTKHNILSLTTREPGGTQFGLTLRSLLLSKYTEPIPPYAELFLYLADRNYHVHSVIKPALEKGYVVVCDRFIDSTLAYQGYARGLPLDTIEKLNAIAVEGVLPDYTFFLDVDPYIGLERAKQRSLIDSVSREESRFENEEITFHQTLSHAYKLIAKNNKRFITINANSSTQRVEEEIIFHLHTIIAT